MKESRYRRYRELAFLGTGGLLWHFVNHLIDTGNWWNALGVVAFAYSLVEITCTAIMDRLERLEQEKALKDQTPEALK